MGRLGFLVANATYSGTATLAPEPTLTTGMARYKKSNIIFTAPQELQRPDNFMNSVGTA
jgi:hypothetical protein